MMFVFGSNLAGRHGKGAALIAKQQYGAIQGQGIGLQGNSYAIPTKDEYLNVLHINTISKFIWEDFLPFVEAHPELEFKITRIGCGLAGFKNEDIAPKFSGFPTNCYFDEGWLPWLGENVNY